MTSQSGNGIAAIECLLRPTWHQSVDRFHISEKCLVNSVERRGRQHAFLSVACLAVSSWMHIARSAPLDPEYEYIVVGSGAGGGPVASRLARAGHKVLLIEAGDDQGTNGNYSVPGYQAAVTQDPKIAWDIYVNHYQDQARARLDPKYVSGKGILYPRAGTLGGCVSHNALIWILPHASDWNNIATLTGDSSWSNANMQQYYQKVFEWQPNQETDPTIVRRDIKLLKHLAGGAAVLGVGPSPVDAGTGLANLLLVDPNAPVPGRDGNSGFFGIPLIMKDGTRVSIRDWIVATAANYPLTIKTNTLVTKVVFDQSSGTPKATGVEFLEGANLYRASPLNTNAAGTPGTVKATKEVILAGGSFNTPQLLKLSGIGPSSELASFGIPVIKDSPGVGTNMQDRYEIPVNAAHPDTFDILDGCTFDMKATDKCYQQWLTQPYVLGERGAYCTNGLAGAMAVKSQQADDGNVDLFIFGGPVNFTGYFPRWGDYAVRDHRSFSWYTLKAHTRNKAGTVKLRSTDPRDQPQIDFNYFDTGTTTNGADQKDVLAMVQAIKMSRQALSNYYKYQYPLVTTSNFTELHPGPQVATDTQIADYIKREAWGHHASCTAAIGADNDPYAVLDSKFRVRGVQNLRVVDASAFPTIPGVFIQAPIFILSEKAADVIMNG